ncbi:MAG: hypothetical protein MJ072_06030, partial [Clostridia bacterium]|nr:hypothetical protein [Clostridia bacterium]
LNEKIKQIIYGVVFGLLAISGTHLGVPITVKGVTAQMNVRDASVLICGLIFGFPSGIIAGVLGGVERFIAGYFWNIGAGTVWACSISTTLAGFYAVFLRKFLFDDKKPNWLLSLAIGVVVEVFHMTMVFFTNMSNPENAMQIVKVCTGPMVIANGLSVMLSAIFISLCSRDKEKRIKAKARISQTIQRWLFLTVSIAFLATSLFVYGIQTRIAEEDVEETLFQENNEIDFLLTGEGETEDEYHGNIFKVIKDKYVGHWGFCLVLDENGEIIKAKDGLGETVDCIPYIYSGVIGEMNSQLNGVEYSDYEQIEKDLKEDLKTAVFGTYDKMTRVTFSGFDFFTISKKTKLLKERNRSLLKILLEKFFQVMNL